MELNIIIEKVEENIEVPTDIGEDNFQFRSDGILLNGKLHFWEEIMYVSICNRGLLRKLKNK